MSTVFVVLAALCWGLSGGIGGLLMAEGWSPFVVSFFRGLIGLLFVFVWLALSPHGSGLASCRMWFWSVVAGIGVAGNFVFYFMSIAEGSVAVAVTLMYCAPVFVCLVSFTLKLERFSLLKWAAIAMVIVGILLLTRVYDPGSGGLTLTGVIDGLCSALFYAVFIFAFKYAAAQGSPQSILTIAFSVLVLILAGLNDIKQIQAVFSAPRLPLFVILGVLGAGLSFILYIVGLNRTSPVVASVAAMIEPVTASLFGVMLLDERLAVVQVVGMALILLTVTALGVFSRVPAESGADIPSDR